MAFDFSGFFKVVREREAAAKAAALKAVDEFGEQVLGDAQDVAPVGGGEHSPRDPAPGTLKGSATSEPATIEGDKIEKVIGFNTEYAAVQHENLEFGHDQGQAKYLSDPMKAKQDKFAPYVAGKVKAAVESASS
jgi:hypothetical protein